MALSGAVQPAVDCERAHRLRVASPRPVACFSSSCVVASSACCTSSASSSSPFCTALRLHVPPPPSATADLASGRNATRKIKALFEKLYGKHVLAPAPTLVLVLRICCACAGGADSDMGVRRPDLMETEAPTLCGV
eukprot:1024209-Rhodomonas_salina.4